MITCRMLEKRPFRINNQRVSDDAEEGGGDEGPYGVEKEGKVNDQRIEISYQAVEQSEQHG